MDPNLLLFTRKWEERGAQCQAGNVMFLRNEVLASGVQRRQSQHKLSRMPRQTRAVPELGNRGPAVGQSAEFIPRGVQSAQAGWGHPHFLGLSRVILEPGEGASDLMNFHRNALIHSLSYHHQGPLSSTSTEEGFPVFASPGVCGYDFEGEMPKVKKKCGANIRKNQHL